MSASDELSQVQLWIRMHIGLALTMAATVVTAVRVARVAHGDLTTAYALISTVGTGSTLVSIVVATLPVMATAGLGFVVGKLRSNRADRKTMALGAALSVTFAFFVPLYLLCVAVAVTLGWPLWHLFREGKLPPDDRQNKLPANVLILLTVTLLALSMVMPDDMWLPPESIEVTPDRPTTGYVLSTEGERVRILLDEPRRVIDVPAADVVARELCGNADPWWTRPLAYAIRKPMYPNCHE